MKLLLFFRSFFKNKEILVSNRKATVPTDFKLMMGKLKFFNKNIGYGLIETKNLEGRIFVDISDLPSHLKVGNMVEFRSTTNQRGYKAIEVKSVHKHQV